MVKSYTNVKPVSVQIILMGFALLLAINILARFNIFDFTAAQSNIITIAGAIFLITEISIFAVLRRAKNGLNTNVIIDISVGIIALIALIGAGFGLFNISIDVLQPIQGIVDTLLMIFVFVELFRKNK